MNIDARKREIWEALEYEDGEFDMLVRISNAYHGKQYYFLQDDGLVYSRASHKYITFSEAVDEFLKEISEG